MQRLWRPERLEFRGESFLISWLFYYCPDSQTEYTDEALDTVNLSQAYIAYALKHELDVRDVIPKS